MYFVDVFAKNRGHWLLRGRLNLPSKVSRGYCTNRLCLLSLEQSKQEEMQLFCIFPYEQVRYSTLTTD